MKHYLSITYKPDLSRIPSYNVILSWMYRNNDFAKLGYTKFLDSDTKLFHKKTMDSTGKKTGELSYYRIISPVRKFETHGGNVYKVLDKDRTEVELIAEVEDDFFEKIKSDDALLTVFRDDIITTFWNSEVAKREEV